MSSDDLRERLIELGLDHTLAVSPGATILPAVAASSSVLTIDARDVDTAGKAGGHAGVAADSRPLPHLSIDLRDSVGSIGRPATEGASADLEVRGILGEGGMGRVFVAYQHSIGREVAVKTAKDDADVVARNNVLYEGATTGRLEHPAIVPVHALGVDDQGRPAIVMKRVDGVAWDALLEDPAHPGWEGWPGTPEDRLAGHLEILMQVCNAVHFAHSRGVVHRDIKPENVLIGRFGDVYVADWGVAGRIGLASAEGVCGTPGFMAPEMVLGEAFDERTDVYLLGATLHYVLTGTPRNAGETTVEALATCLRGTPCSYDTSVPAELAELCNRACHFDPSERQPSAKAFRDAITSFLQHRVSAALSSMATERVRRCEELSALADPDAATRQELERLITEAHFGLEQALGEWPDNPTALDARASLDRLLERRRLHTAELERFAREQDPTQGARTRAVSFSILAAVAVLVITIALTRANVTTLTMYVVNPTILLLAFVATAFALRRRIVFTEFNRRMFWLIVIAFVYVILGRLAGFFVEVELHFMFARDLFVSSAILAIAGVTVIRWMIVGAVIMAVGAVLALALPPHSQLVFGVASASTIIVMAVASWLPGGRSGSVRGERDENMTP